MKPTLGVVPIVLLMATGRASAHHAFSAEFDATKCSDITGILTKVNYENPHSYIFVNVTNPDGKVVEATFQLSSTTNLRRGGADRPTLMKSVGHQVTVRGCAARTGEPNRYAAPWMKLADGTIQRVGQDVEGNLGAAEKEP
jgi:Family of unknown function (DUF6152)